MKVSPTLINHYEIGRADFYEEYLEKFLKAVNFKRLDFEKMIKGGISDDEIRGECIDLIRELSLVHLDIFYKLLSNF